MTTNRIIALFTLKPGVDIAAYEAWAREVDLPTVNGLPSIIGFEVFKAKSVLGSDAKPPYQYIAREFQAIADVTFILTEPLLPTPAGQAN
jgi:hypothetical protein